MSIQALRERLAHVKKLNLDPQYFGGERMNCKPPSRRGQGIKIAPLPC